MYAVIKTGGKQYRVAVGDKLKVESLSNAEAGDNVTIDQVLMIVDGDNTEIGTPLLNKSVEATVVSNGRGKKLRVVKFRRRQNSRTRTGHRQNYTEIEITSIGGKATKKVAKKTTKKATEIATKKTTTKEKSATAKESKTSSGGDDLTKISGVGPVMVSKLEKLGITTYQQVADFTAEDIARIDEELNFKGRIERDDWVKQAAELAKGE